MTVAHQTSPALALSALLALAACTTLTPPTNPEDIPGSRPNYVAGYLQKDQLPDSLALLPAPPAPGSNAFAADEDMHKRARALHNTLRWKQAIEDAELNFPQASQVFSCALDMTISAEATPHLNMLLRRVRADASRATDKAKDHYKRARPFGYHKEESCTPKYPARNDSYPSGHTSIGWAWALTLAELAPERTDAILVRGVNYGKSRLVCNVHWASDVEAGRVIGAATVSRLHADPVYVAQMAAAKKEIAAARAAGLKSPRDCAAEAAALALGP